MVNFFVCANMYSYIPLKQKRNDDIVSNCKNNNNNIKNSDASGKEQPVAIVCLMKGLFCRSNIFYYKKKLSLKRERKNR